MEIDLLNTQEIAAMSLSLEELKGIARAAAKEASLSKEDIGLIVVVAVKETLVTLGVDASEPLEMQKDFQSLRTSRKSKEELGKKLRMFFLGAILSGIAGFVVVGFKMWAVAPI